MSGWINLSKICQNKGLVGVPAFVMRAMMEAFKLPVDRDAEASDPDTFFRRYLINKDERTEKIMKLAHEKHLVVMRPVWHPLTVNEIEVDLSQWPNPTVALTTDKLSATWRWKYWYPAFSFFWAFIFHTENEFLRRPEIIWNELNRYTNDFVNQERIAGGAGDYQRFYLALWERTGDVLSDIRHCQPHYVKNIRERAGLSPEDSRERPKLFQEAVLYLRKQLEEKLLA